MCTQKYGPSSSFFSHILSEVFWILPMCYPSYLPQLSFPHPIWAHILSPRISSCPLNHLQYLAFKFRWRQKQCWIILRTCKQWISRSSILSETVMHWDRRSSCQLNSAACDGSVILPYNGFSITVIAQALGHSWPCEVEIASESPYLPVPPCAMGLRAQQWAFCPGWSQLGVIEILIPPFLFPHSTFPQELLNPSPN